MGCVCGLECRDLRICVKVRHSVGEETLHCVSSAWGTDALYTVRGAVCVHTLRVGACLGGWGWWW